MDSQNKKRELLSSADAAAYLGLSPDSLTVMRCRGSVTIPYYKVGRRVMYDRAELDAWLEDRRVVPQSPED